MHEYAVRIFCSSSTLVLPYQDYYIATTQHFFLHHRMFLNQLNGEFESKDDEIDNFFIE